MKKTKFLTAIAAVSLAITAMVSNAATVNFNDGDLIVGFTAGGGQGSGQVVLVSLGDVTTLRNLSTPNLSLSNISQILSNTYGSTWYDRTDLYFGAVALFNIDDGSGTITNGDPMQTIYASKTRTTVGTAGSAGSTAWTVGNSGNRNTIANNIINMQDNATSGFNVATADPSNASAAIMNSAGTTWDVYNPPGAGAANNTSFGAALTVTGLGIQQAFSGGTYGTFSGTTIEGAVDLYRILNSNGSSTLAGTVTVQSNGDIGFAAAVPEPSTWALVGLGLFSVLIFRRRSALLNR